MVDGRKGVCPIKYGFINPRGSVLKQVDNEKLRLNQLAQLYLEKQLLNGSGSGSSL